jgi:hypothetical protein
MTGAAAANEPYSYWAQVTVFALVLLQVYQHATVTSHGIACSLVQQCQAVDQHYICGSCIVLNQCLICLQPYAASFSSKCKPRTASGLAFHMR